MYNNVYIMILVSGHELLYMVYVHVFGCVSIVCARVCVYVCVHVQALIKSLSHAETAPTRTPHYS